MEQAIKQPTNRARAVSPDKQARYLRRKKLKQRLAKIQVYIAQLGELTNPTAGHLALLETAKRRAGEIEARLG